MLQACNASRKTSLGGEKLTLAHQLLKSWQKILPSKLPYAVVEGPKRWKLKVSLQKPQTSLKLISLNSTHAAAIQAART
jgi:hypothetical protein